MLARGLYKAVNDEVGELIVADVDHEAVRALAGDKAGLESMIQHG